MLKAGHHRIPFFRVLFELAKGGGVEGEKARAQCTTNPAVGWTAVDPVHSAEPIGGFIGLKYAGPSKNHRWQPHLVEHPLKGGDIFVGGKQYRDVGWGYRTTFFPVLRLEADCGLEVDEISDFPGAFLKRSCIRSAIAWDEFEV